MEVHKKCNKLQKGDYCAQIRLSWSGHIHQIKPELQSRLQMKTPGEKLTKTIEDDLQTTGLTCKNSRDTAKDRGTAVMPTVLQACK